MDEFLAIALSYPTVVYTVLLAVSVIYWMVGLLGFGLDSADGHVDGHIDGDMDFDAGEVGGHGHAHGDITPEGHLDVEAEASSESDADARSRGSRPTGVLAAVFGILGFLRLRNAPLSITLSLLFLTAWAGTFFGVHYLLPAIGGSALVSTLIAAAAMGVAIPVTSLVTRPLKGVFEQRFAPGARHLVGRVGVVRIGSTSGGRVQVRLKDAAAGEKGLLLRVAVDDALEPGDEVLLVDFDDEAKSYVAEPMKAVLPENGRR